MNFLAYKMAASIKKTVPSHAASIEVLAFSLSLLLNGLSTILLALVISLFTGHILSVIMVLLSFALLRAVSGGIHLKSGILCSVTSAAAANIIPFLTLSNELLYIMNGCSIILCLLYAPSRIDQQTRIPRKYYPLLKVISLLIITVSLVNLSSLFTITFFIQCLLLIKKNEE